MNGVRVDLARFDEVLDFGDGDPATHRCQRIEVSSCAAKHQVAVAVSLPGPDETEISDDRLFEDELPITITSREDSRVFGWGGLRHGAVAVVFPRQASLGDLGADAGRGEERGNA